MRVRVRFFAGTRDAAGTRTLDVDVPDAADVEQLWTQLERSHPRLAPYRDASLVAVDGAFVTQRAALRDGAEIAIMPPVSGGSGALIDGPLSLDALIETMPREGAGAIVTFLGVVRPTSGAPGSGRVVELRFEAYPEMAEREIARLGSAATAKFDLIGCQIQHRLGVLDVGTPIVAVATAAAHRASAFEAAQWLMDELKASVPIWKQEVDDDGATRWVNDPTREVDA